MDAPATASRRRGATRLAVAPAVALAVALALVALAGSGCAHVPFTSLGKQGAPSPVATPGTSETIGPEGPVSPAADPGTIDPRQWAALSRAGHRAMRQGDHVTAEQSFVAALRATTTFSRDDARTRASLGNLVKLAAAYRRMDRPDAADRVMSIIGETVEAARTQDYSDQYEQDASRFRELIAGPGTLPIGRIGSTPTRAPRAPRNRRFDAVISQTAHSFGLEPALVKAVVAAESNFDTHAVSRVGALGLMQLMPETARAMGVETPFEAVENLKGGTRYLSELLGRYGDLSMALAAYNAGPKAVDRYEGIPPYPETREYVRKVLDFYRGYRARMTN